MLHWLLFEFMIIADFQSGVIFFYFNFRGFCKSCNDNGKYTVAVDSTAFHSDVPGCILNSWLQIKHYLRGTRTPAALRVQMLLMAVS